MTRIPLLASQPAALGPSREQMAFTLAYHIILAPLGVAFPLLTVLIEGIGLRRNDLAALRLAQWWSSSPLVLSLAPSSRSSSESCGRA